MPIYLKGEAHKTMIITVLMYGTEGCISRLFRLLRRQINVYTCKHFSGAVKVCINTSPAPERCFKYFPGFPGAGEVSDKYIYGNTSPAPDKYLYTLFQRRRSAYIHLSGAGEAGKVFIYPGTEAWRVAKREELLLERTENLLQRILGFSLKDYKKCGHLKDAGEWGWHVILTKYETK